MTRKEKINKLLSDELSEEEKKELFLSKEMTRQLYLQWEYASSAKKAGLPTMARIWRNVKKNTFEREEERRQVYFYKIYSLVASVLLVLGLSAVLYWSMSHPERNEMYIVCSGIRSIHAFMLPDSSVVNLGSNSKLTYPKHFDGKNREVYLDGQGFFSVRENKANPFVVRTPQMNVTVLGTEFEVFNYEKEPKVETILLNGHVKIFFPDKGGKYLSLSPDEKMSYDKKEGSIILDSLDADRYTAWRKGNILSFENEKLSMIIPRLEKWYNRKIVCPESILNHYRFTFKVSDESLERILSIMSKSAPLKYKEKEDGSFEIYL